MIELNKNTKFKLKRKKYLKYLFEYYLNIFIKLLLTKYITTFKIQTNTYTNNLS